MSAGAKEMGNIVQCTIKAVGSDDTIFGILQVLNELKKSLFLRNDREYRS